MSLFEQFHSDINKKYMFNMVKTIINKEFNKDITGDENYKGFINTLETIFRENNSDNISELNKILLDSEVDKYRSKYGSELEETVIVNNNNIKATSIDELIKQREQQNIEPINTTNDVDKKGTNIFGTSITSLIKNEPINSDNEGIIEDINEEEKEEFKETEVKGPGEEILKSISINSSQRTSINSSRYNYLIDLDDNEIQSKDIKYVSKMIIPLENNYMFSIPVLILKIPELNVLVYMQLEEKVTISDVDFGIYIPLNKHEIDVNNVTRITIQINDITMTEYTSLDILKVNIVQIQDNKIGLTCSNINSLNYKVGDNIKIINNHTYDLYKLSRIPLQINNIVDNILYCWLPVKFNNCLYNDCDMKVLNLSNQNIIFFNQPV